MISGRVLIISAWVHMTQLGEICGFSVRASLGDSILGTDFCFDNDSLLQATVHLELGRILFEHVLRHSLPNIDWCKNAFWPRNKDSGEMGYVRKERQLVGPRSMKVDFFVVDIAAYGTKPICSNSTSMKPKIGTLSPHCVTLRTYVPKRVKTIQVLPRTLPSQLPNPSNVWMKELS